MSRLVVVSGGGSGIGRATARAFAAEGAEVIILGRRTRPLATTAEELNASVSEPLVRPLAADLRDPTQVDRIAEAILAGGRTVDVLVNNAGGNVAPRPHEDLVELRDDWLANLGGNVLPAVLLTQRLLPALRRPNGRIITVSSVAAFQGPATYGGAKAALHPWSAELAQRLAPDGITANVVAPGYVVGTEFYGARMSAELHADRSSRAPMNRGGTVDEIAGTIVYLASAGAGFITGQIIQANGGRLFGRG